jgi:hypothetical protein
MNPQDAKKITTRDDARQFAIDWHHWQSTEVLYLSEMCRWYDALTELANKFDLVDEFTENGII